MRVEDARSVARIKALFAPDGGAEREHNARDGTLGFGAIHYALVTNLRPRRALVIGSRYGYVPSIVALAMRAIGEGEVDFVDANYSDEVHGFATSYGGVGHWADGGEGLTGAVFGEYVNVHVMRSDEYFRDCEQTYGYVYLDGNHGYQTCREDLDAALARLEPDGVVALHDVAVDAPEFGVARVLAELDRTRFATLVIPSWPGLGIVQPIACVIRE